MSKNTAHEMVQIASRLFKRYYGAWPERIGLDYFTRWPEYGRDYFGDYYYAQENMSMPAIDFNDPDWATKTCITYERVQIKIEPAIFGKIEYYPGNVVMRGKPKKGRDEVLCEGNGVKVYMTIWFTEQGHHAIVWDQVEEES